MSLIIVDPYIFPISDYQTSVKIFPGNSNGVTSNFDVDIQTANANLSYLNDGIYDAWCIDKDVLIVTGVTYATYSIFSGTESQDRYVSPPLRTGFAYDKLDNINWLLSQGYAGTNAFGTGTIFSFDFQNAIWLLLGQQPASYLPNAKVTELVSRANALGEGFVASAGQKQGLMLAEATNSVQPLIIVTQAAQLGGLVAYNDNPFSGMTVKLFRDFGFDGTRQVDVTLTDVNGLYIFRGLTAGFDYQVLFDSTPISKPFKTSSYVTLQPGENNNNVNAIFED
jgi:hypothetical protein